MRISSDLLLSGASREFIHKITEADFPCVGAKSAVARGTLDIVEARDITSAWNDLHIHRRLLDWSDKCRGDREGLRSLAVVFGGPRDLNEGEFEAAMWDRLQSLADKDHWLGQRFDETVSADPVLSVQCEPLSLRWSSIFEG